MIKFLSKLFNRNNETEEESVMKYLIVGLGNIGDKYAQTRHNVGFEVVDYLAHKFDVSFKMESLGELAKFKHKGRSVHLLKPNTFMNRSGKSVRHWLTKLKVPTENLLIVVDDLHLPIGALRLREKGKDAGHNGLKDIENVLGSQKYPRLKFGIGNNFSKGQQVDFVLGKWTTKEIDELQELIPKSADICLSFVAIGAKYTMDQFNKK